MLSLLYESLHVVTTWRI